MGGFSFFSFLFTSAVEKSVFYMGAIQWRLSMSDAVTFQGALPLGLDEMCADYLPLASRFR